MAANSGEQIGFKINPNGEKETAKVEQPATGAATNKPEQEDLTRPYEDKSSVTIALVENYSLYRKVNRVSLPKRVDYIGSCIESSRRLSANKVEAEKYFPNVIGIMPNHENFLTRVKQYLNNIRIAVDEQGVTFDTSFRYDHKEDYLKVQAELEEIEKRPSIVGYVAKEGEDLWNLAKRYRTSVEAIRDVNELGDRPVKAGDRLLIFKENVSIL